LDLGIGEANYKKAWCNQADLLFDAFIATTLIGSISTNVVKLGRRIKRVIKQTPFLWKLAVKFT
ncbi:MAG: hypothetical protein K8F25_18180, partial [Fimbriimonadaceae bacterium]|nr:hypothetical protein [Alphaproteobacteria bacterium]